MIASATSPVGAKGLMQIMPSTGKEMGLTPQQLMDPNKAIYASTAYIRWLEKNYFSTIQDPKEKQQIGRSRLIRYQGRYIRHAVDLGQLTNIEGRVNSNRSRPETIWKSYHVDA